MNDEQRIQDAAESIRSFRNEIFALQENHSQYYAWMDYFKEFGDFPFFYKKLYMDVEIYELLI